MDIEELISYIHQLETENKQLQKHIFNIQQQLNQKNQAIVILTQKLDSLSEHIQKCQNQIIKREERQVAYIQEVHDLRAQIGLYIEEIANVKDKQIYKQLKVESDGQVKSSIARATKMPPKSQQKCKTCDSLANDRDGLFSELQKQRQRCYILERDLECIIGTYSST